MSQPKWRFVANLGDASPLEHGGYFVYRDTTGVYDHEAELLVEPEDTDDRGARWTVYRIELDRCKIVREDNTVYLVPFAYDAAAYLHPVSSYVEWFAKDLDRVASFIGSTREEMERELCSENPLERAHAYRAIGDYHGWRNLDDYPLTLTRAEVKKRYRGRL